MSQTLALTEEQLHDVAIPERRTGILALSFAGLAIGVGLGVLLGWALDVGLLKSGLPGYGSMKPNAAIGVVLAGVALCGVRRDRVPSWSIGLATIVGLLSAVTVGQSVIGFDAGIDEWVFDDSGDAPHTGHPGRMSPRTAVALIALSLATLALRWRRLVLARALTIGAAALAFLALVGYAHGISTFYRGAVHTAMALPAAVSLLLLAAALFTARLPRGLEHLLGGDDEVGRVSRRLLGLAVVLPFVCGLAIHAGIDAGWYDPDWGLPLFTVLATFALTTLVLAHGIRLGDLETKRAAAQRALEVSESRFRGSFNKAFVGIAHVRFDGGWIRLNDTLCALLGYPSEELERLSLDEVIHPDDLAGHRAKRAAVEEGAIERERMELRCRRRDGSDIWVELQIAMQRDVDHGEPYGIVTFLDVSDRKRREVHHQALAGVVEATAEFVGICDLEFRPTYVNTFGRRMVGLESLEEACEKSVLDYFWPEDLERIEAEAVPAILEHGEWLGEVRFRNFRTGEPIHTRWNVSTIRDELGRPTAYATVSPDLNSIKATEEKLRSTAAHLEEANRQKDRFLGLLGHELRNPLGAIRSALTVLRSTDDEREKIRMRRIVERQTTHVARLVDDLVDLARIESGKLHVELTPCNLAAFVRMVVRESEPEAASVGVSLRAEVPHGAVHADIDRTRLRQVLLNLLTNAFRATPSGEVVVRLTVDDGSARIAVRDTGRGISAEELERIFQPFEQGPGDGETPPPGLGLGLPLARELIARQHGTLTATSEGPGRGSEFVITLPVVAPEASTTADPPSRPPADDTPRKIIVIDDHEDSADSLSELLRLSRHEVHVAYDGEVGIELARRLRPDVVISDLCLPKIDGFGVARALRECDGPRVRLVALTGLAGDSTEAEAHAAGFDACLTKPTDLARLLELL